MSKSSKLAARVQSRLVEVKSEFDAEYRRFSVKQTARSYEEFGKLIAVTHHLEAIPFVTCYIDPEGDLLPINNDDNFQKALSTAKPLLRVVIQKKGQSLGELNGYGTVERRKKNPILAKLIQSETRPKSHMAIGLPDNFRRVSAIIDVDVIPESHRRVKLMKNGSDKPLGFYIRDGTSVRVTPHGLEKVPGIFVSRLVPGGLAESTGLLAVNDEVLEVNGIEVVGKTLDQVTDMMVANSTNLIVTVKPVNQRNNISPHKGGDRGSQKSTDSYRSARSGTSFDSDEVRTHEEEEDLVKDHLSPVETDAPITELAQDIADQELEDEDMDGTVTLPVDQGGGVVETEQELSPTSSEGRQRDESEAQSQKDDDSLMTL